MLKFRASTCAALAVLTVLLCAGLCSASDVPASYHFTAMDFLGSGGIAVTSVPDSSAGTLRCGSRRIQAGDVLSQDMLAQLEFCAASEEPCTAVIRYLPVGGALQPEQELQLEVLGRRRNEAPSAEDFSFETYKNIAFTGTLPAEDPEGGALTYSILTPPKRGVVEIAADGSFTYTPKKNKVGRDSFIFTATDADGAVSSPATVSIEIRKPENRETFADMAGREGEYYAMWAREQGLLSGETVAGALCFSPDKPVTRGEFVAMVMRLFDLDVSDSALTSGFADETDTPVWMRPYLTSAISAGIVSGIPSDRGMVFRAGAAITEAEAAVMLQNLLQFPSAAPVSEPAEEVWAQSAVSALAGAGVRTLDCSSEPLTRLACAELLCSASRAADTGRYGLLSWAAD